MNSNDHMHSTAVSEATPDERMLNSINSSQAVTARSGRSLGSVIRRVRKKKTVALHLDAGALFHSVEGEHDVSKLILAEDRSSSISQHYPHTHFWDHVRGPIHSGTHHHHPHDQPSLALLFALGSAVLMLAYFLFTRGRSKVTMAFEKCKGLSNLAMGVPEGKACIEHHKGRVVLADSSFSLSLALAESGVSIITLNSVGRGLDALAEEVQSNVCKLLWLPHPKTRNIRLVRLVRILRVLIRHKGHQHDELQLLCEGSRTVTTLPCGKKKQEREAVDRPFTFKMNLDEQDVIQACQTEIQRRLCLPQDMQETHLMFVCNGNQAVITSRVEAGDSKNFPGIHTWYLIDEIELYTKLQESSMLGLGTNNGFTTTSSDSHSTIERSWSWVPESKLDLYPAKQFRSSDRLLPSMAEFKFTLESCEH
eukprot:TRINITY_DN15828_c0_g1_i1.p1 TRINITY_DN15828_c0_g1~~TRINITY_DN15828_c0_g1_i1.p1  ORF type:complete len:456 (-),score=68.94 TRINITY_DN15828_c0_g1_i1:25-1290(-)